MTFNQLRNELAKCGDNIVKERIIRNLMVIKYNQHIQNKKRPARNEKIVFDETDFESPSPQKETAKKEPVKKEPEKPDMKDSMNTKLSRRLGNDIDIMRLKTNPTEPIFIPPYADGGGGNYASF